jgi:hypothetical protein
MAPNIEKHAPSVKQKGLKTEQVKLEELVGV